jgi:hypothetical protein
MDTKTLLLLVGGLVGVQAMPAARADEIPFTITTPAGIAAQSLHCVGPFLRRSECTDLHGGDDHRVFYSAEKNIFPPFGQWTCALYELNSLCRETLASIHFCIADSSPPQVDLSVVGNTRQLKVNAQLCSTSSALSTITANAVLGHDGEDARRAQDLDTWDLRGTPGERVVLTLDRDGSAGSTGETALLRVLNQGGGAIARRRGLLPIELNLTLPGPVQIIVQRQADAGDTFRGGYSLAVRLLSSSDVSERLTPSENVEH